ncbi:MAG: PHP domain-containing protein [Dehalococcoidia bacterium]
MRADLHLHTTASDGLLSPRELVEMAAAKGMEVIAVTDHDSVSGITSALEAAEDFPQLTVIPGVEINTDVPRGEVHVLGYFLDYSSPALESTLVRLRDGRKTRARKMVARLGELGLSIEWDRVRELAGDGSVGRPHVAQAILERGYVSSFKEAFNKYIGREGPAYVQRDKLSPREAVKLVTDAGGVAVLAHPADIEALDSLLPDMVSAGLVGLEGHYGSYSADVVRRLELLAQKHGLFVTGGSDFHGLDSDETPLGGVHISGGGVERLLALGESRTRDLSPSPPPPPSQ